MKTRESIRNFTHVALIPQLEAKKVIDALSDRHWIKNERRDRSIWEK